MDWLVYSSHILRDFYILWQNFLQLWFLSFSILCREFNMKIKFHESMITGLESKFHDKYHLNWSENFYS